MDLAALFTRREHHFANQRPDRLSGVPVGLWFIERLRQFGDLGAVKGWRRWDAHPAGQPELAPYGL